MAVPKAQSCEALIVLAGGVRYNRSSMSTRPASPRKLLHSTLLSKGRMEALADGIFAIAMTLLVLELKGPLTCPSRRTSASCYIRLARRRRAADKTTNPLSPSS